MLPPVNESLAVCTHDALHPDHPRSCDTFRMFPISMLHGVRLKVWFSCGGRLCEHVFETGCEDVSKPTVAHIGIIDGHAIAISPATTSPEEPSTVPGSEVYDCLGYELLLDLEREQDGGRFNRLSMMATKAIHL